MTDTIKSDMQNTKKVILFAIALTHAIEKSLGDKEFTLADIPNFLPAFMKLIPAIDSISEVVVDLHGATKEDADEIKQLVKDELNLNDDQVEAFVENAFAIALDIALLVRDFLPKSGEITEPTEDTDRVNPEPVE